MLTAGMQVLIEGESSWSVGTIEEIRQPNQLPSIAGAPAAAIAGEILEEMHVERVAIISHAGMLFAALEASGSWWDLQQQRLTITPIAEARRP
jgi:hypothetical protein